jgi:hypothetical protein
VDEVYDVERCSEVANVIEAERLATCPHCAKLWLRVGLAIALGEERWCRKCYRIQP